MSVLSSHSSDDCAAPARTSRRSPSRQGDRQPGLPADRCVHREAIRQPPPAHTIRTSPKRLSGLKLLDHENARPCARAFRAGRANRLGVRAAATQGSRLSPRAASSPARDRGGRRVVADYGPGRGWSSRCAHRIRERRGSSPSTLISRSLPPRWRHSTSAAFGRTVPIPCPRSAGRAYSSSSMPTGPGSRHSGAVSAALLPQPARRQGAPRPHRRRATLKTRGEDRGSGRSPRASVVVPCHTLSSRPRDPTRSRARILRLRVMICSERGSLRAPPTFARNSKSRNQ